VKPLSILETEELTYTYSTGTPFEKTAVDHVNLKIEKNCMVGVIGHTGSGKSTLVNLLNGLYRPTEGTVLLDSKDIWKNPKQISKIRTQVGLVMQYPEYQLFDETVRADIGFAPRNLGLDAEEVERRVAEAVAFTGIPSDLLDRSPFELSGGQKRRVAIAGVMAMGAGVLVLDEPAAGLDPRGRREILDGVRAYAKKNGLTVILVSHSMEDMALYCDNVIVMNRGRVYAAGTVDEVFSDAEGLMDIGLNVPMVARIATALRKKGIPLEGTLYTVAGVKDAILRLRKEGGV
jgi:energy-coupling factor transport system ATP-binding protein